MAKIGRQAGLDIWIARNDRSTVVDGERLGDLSVEGLPEGLPAEVLRTIALIDVVWIRRNLYVAAFEIEATTPVFKRERVFAELTRPLFRLGSIHLLRRSAGTSPSRALRMLSIVSARAPAWMPSA